MSGKLLFPVGFALIVAATLVLMADAATTPPNAATRTLGTAKNPAFVCSARGILGSRCGTIACPCSVGAYSNYCNQVQSGACSCPFNACDQSAGLADLAETVEEQVRA